MILSRLSELGGDTLSRLLNRSKATQRRIIADVEKIVEDVKNRGDEALRYYTLKYDGVELDNFRVTANEFEDALSSVGENVLEALQVSAHNIKEFHEYQLRRDWFYEKDGIKLGQIVRPIGRVGCYIPGGRAAYPSTVLMTVIPAKTAGVREVTCITPPGKGGSANPYVLAACHVAGVDEVYKVGGAQGIAALAYGTESIRKVDKIVGPGNIYVQAAKRIVSEDVAADFPAGPSEVLIIADSTAKPSFVALDMIAQAEHDPNASSVLVTTSERLAKEVKDLIEREDKTAEASASLKENGAIIIVDSLEEAVEFSNTYSPEHLEIITQVDVLSQITNAGSIFIGSYTPVACGDYASGTNHVLPTAGYSKFYSGLSVNDFIKTISVQEVNKKGLKKLAHTIITLAEAEGLRFHAESVRRRIK
jgi:histidinol dehydrogenase